MRNDSTSIIEAYARTIQGETRDDRLKNAYKKYTKDCLFAFNRLNSSRNENGITTHGPVNPFPNILTMVRHAMSATAATPDAM